MSTLTGPGACSRSRRATARKQRAQTTVSCLFTTCVPWRRNALCTSLGTAHSLSYTYARTPERISVVALTLRRLEVADPQTARTSATSPPLSPRATSRSCTSRVISPTFSSSRPRTLSGPQTSSAVVAVSNLPCVPLALRFANAPANLRRRARHTQLSQ